MNKDVTISIYMDSRRAKSNGKYPVKLRVYHAPTKRQKLYPLPFEMSKREFESIWNTIKPRAEHKEIRRSMQEHEHNAQVIADRVVPFSFELFEREIHRSGTNTSILSMHYKQRITDLNKRGQISTAGVYALSERAIKEFVECKKAYAFERLTLADITPDWLHDFEYFLTAEKGRSITTASMYLRALRAIFNEAIASKDIELDAYPFGKRRYQVPSVRNAKRALSPTELKALYNAIPQSVEQAKAKDFWFFSYNCSGMNMKDIALLRWKDVDDKKLRFIRAKTKTTSKAHLTTIEVVLNDFAKTIISKYGTTDRSPNDLVFDIISDGDNAELQRRRIKNFTKFINQHMKKLARIHALPTAISTYWARHSFATTSVRKGAPVFWLQTQMGHTSVKTTQGYVDSMNVFDQASFSETLMDF